MIVVNHRLGMLSASRLVGGAPLALIIKDASTLCE